MSGYLTVAKTSTSTGTVKNLSCRRGRTVTRVGDRPTEAPTLYQLKAGSYTAAVTYAGNTGQADFRVALVGIG